MGKTVRVGNAGGYWGDDPHALQRQLTQGSLDYVTQDFLAEITMSILQKQRARNARLGYATDFLDQVRVCLPILRESGTKIISNAGGINPRGCAEEVERISRDMGITCSIAVVQGDNLLDQLDQLLKKGIRLDNLETGEDFLSVQDRVESANAYLGAAPVVKALEEGAQIVITGRVTDTGIAVAPPVFEFDWSLQDWDRLASGVVAGHILECGAHASGGNLTDWQNVPSFLNLGYPIVEFSRDGSFQVSKHDHSGGLVNRETVTSQLVYEMGDPENYLTPDVIADFSSIHLKEEGQDCVKVSGVVGRPRTDQLKVSISHHSGYKAHGTMIVSRPEATAKCRAMAAMFWDRLDLDFEETSTELVGHSACHSHLAPEVDPPEVLLRLGVRDPNRQKVEEFAKNFTSLILSSVSGVAIVGAKPRVQNVIAYWPTLVPASEVSAEVILLNSGRSFQIGWDPVTQETTNISEPSIVSDREAEPPIASERQVRAQLDKLCYARSGDKGNTCNIGVVARSPEIYDWMRRDLTSGRVKRFFGEICQGEVDRYEIPNLLALNFLLHASLGGGGTVSLRIDPQGKTLADALLGMAVDVPEALVHTLPQSADKA